MFEVVHFCVEMEVRVGAGKRFCCSPDGVGVKRRRQRAEQVSQPWEGEGVGVGVIFPVLSRQPSPRPHKCKSAPKAMFSDAWATHSATAIHPSPPSIAILWSPPGSLHFQVQFEFQFQFQSKRKCQSPQQVKLWCCCRRRRRMGGGFFACLLACLLG